MTAARRLPEAVTRRHGRIAIVRLASLARPMPTMPKIAAMMPRSRPIGRDDQRASTSALTPRRELQSPLRYDVRGQAGAEGIGGRPRASPSISAYPQRARVLAKCGAPTGRQVLVERTARRSGGSKDGQRARGGSG